MRQTIAPLFGEREFQHRMLRDAIGDAQVDGAVDDTARDQATEEEEHTGDRRVRNGERSERIQFVQQLGRLLYEEVRPEDRTPTVGQRHTDGKGHQHIAEEGHQL